MNQPLASIAAQWNSTSRTFRTACLLVGSLPLFPALAGAQPANSPAEVFQRLNADNWISRDLPPIPVPM